MSSSLAVEELNVSFGGVAALSDVSISFPTGKIVGIIGPNGAGKTTLLNAVCGMFKVNGGRVLLDGTDVTGIAPNKIAQCGIRRTFQTSRLFRGMTVLENMMTGLHLSSRVRLFECAFRTPAMAEEESEMFEKAMQALDFVGFAKFAERPADALSFGQQRIVEIARTLIHDPRVVILDEPAVGLSITRVAELDRLLRRIRDERGVTIIMIEHVIRLVMGVADHIVVLNSGRKIAEGSPDSVRADPAVIEAYLGHQGRD